jgi:serine O-acetyltransferase
MKPECSLNSHQVCLALGVHFNRVEFLMKISLDKSNLIKYLELQIKYNFPDKGNLLGLINVVPAALEKLAYCFGHSRYAQNWKDGVCYFNHLNADQYTVFLYFCSKIAFFKYSNIQLASKLFYLNKILHSFHCMYDTELPDIFLVLHGSGIVLGKALYSNYFVVTQGCTVGSNARFEQPKLGTHVIMYPYSSITGNTIVGNNTCFASGSFVSNENIKDNSLIIGKSPNLLIKNNRTDRFNSFY